MTLAEKIIMEGTIAHDNRWGMVIQVGEDVYKLQWSHILNHTSLSREIRALKLDKKQYNHTVQPDYIRDALMILAWPRIWFDDMG